MEEILDLLIEIQKLDDEIKNIQSHIEKNPYKINALEKEIEDAQHNLQDKKERLHTIKKTYKMKEGDIAENESKINKLNSQTFAVKTNEEYRAIINEVEFV